jgi:hypothetical protein
VSYAIMLYRDMAGYKDDWPVRRLSHDIGSLRKERQYSGNPTLLPRTLYTMEHIEEKSLIDAQTGSVETGAIYRCTHKS